MSRAISALAPADLHLEQYSKVPKVGYNPGHEGILNELYSVKHLNLLLKFLYEEFCHVSGFEEIASLG